MGAAVAGTTSFRPAPSYTTLRDVTLLLGIAAIVLGVMGKRKAGRGASPSGRGAAHRGKAQAGLLLGVLTTVLSILLPVLAIALLSGESSDLRRSVEDLIQREQVEGTQPGPEAR